MRHGTYIGTRVCLQGKSALLRTGPDCALAQFDDRSLEEAFGWHEFLWDDFEVDPKVDWEEEEE